MIEFRISSVPRRICTNRNGVITTGDSDLDRLFTFALLRDTAELTPDIPDREAWQITRLGELTGSSVEILTPDPADEDDAGTVY